ncbi:hypothetical protein OG874_32315 [Nocardia sp. NBC_00565]|uniref:hypothetical protein n=1 Tax=Nocardia sp. NBC_00565 TaxID=2975993 RepID=UPI002E800C9A|nr:hypothetical protein [Nocardia sp. NBC_00565]WUC01453.1 hypothetical protein OG874_32315 [Nocardia sp. NBC_00565]
MRSISRFVITVLGALVAIALTVGFASTASAEPVASPDPVAPVASSEPSSATSAQFICLPPGDTIEARTAIGGILGAAIGGIAGLPLFFIGAIPGLVIGGLLGVLIGSTSYAVDAGHEPGPC